MVPAGSTIGVSVAGTTGGFVPIDATDLRSRVADDLGATFGLVAFTLSKGSLLGNLVDFQWWHWEFSATLTITTRVAYASIEDVRAIVAHSFYQAAGVMPTVAVTGEPSGPAVVSSGPSVGGFLGGLADRLQVSALVLVVGLVGVVALVAYGPNIGSLARAAR